MSILSKKKEQVQEYKKIKNEKFDAQIKKSQAKTAKIEKEKAKFNEEIDKYISTLKDLNTVEVVSNQT